MTSPNSRPARAAACAAFFAGGGTGAWIEPLGELFAADEPAVVGVLDGGCVDAKSLCHAS